MSYVGRSVGLESQKAADLNGLGVDNASAHVVFRIGIDAFEQGEAIANQLRFHLRRVHRVHGLVNLLGLLARSGKIIIRLHGLRPALQYK